MKKNQLIMIIVAFVCDQVSKVIISTYLNLNDSIPVIKNFFNITLNYNYGAAWGILKNNTIFLIIISIIAIIIIMRYSYSFKKNIRNNIAFSILLGGIAGNLADRLFLGYVRDFLDFKIGSYNFPIFNLADTFIVIGVTLLIIAILKGEDKNGKNRKRHYEIYQRRRNPDGGLQNR